MLLACDIAIPASNCCVGATLTTSVLVILASRSVRLSRLSLWSLWSSWRPQIAAAMLPVAIMEGGFMARRSSVKERCLNEIAAGGSDAITGLDNKSTNPLLGFPLFRVGMQVIHHKSNILQSFCGLVSSKNILEHLT